MLKPKIFQDPRNKGNKAVKPIMGNKTLGLGTEL
jgi:hypothetical protein